MAWLGSVKCPDCDLPLDVDASVCPHCFSSRPHTGAWQLMPIGQYWWAFVPVFIGFAAVIGTMISDNCFGTKLLPALLTWFESLLSRSS